MAKITADTRFLYNRYYLLSGFVKGERVLFRARYINRLHGLGPAFSGTLENTSRKAHLSLKNAIEKEWELVG